MAMLPKLIYRFNAIPIRNPTCLFCRNWQTDFKIHIKIQGPWMAIIISKKNKTGGLILPNFKTCHKAVVIKAVWYWHKNKPREQWRRIESSNINSYIYGQLIFVK